MLLLTGKTLQETLNNFNQESERVDALNYNEFLNNDFYNGYSIMDVLYELQKVVKYSKRIPINKRLSNKTNINLVLEFYNKLGLSENLEQILLGNHPMFKTTIDKNLSSRVGHKCNDPKIEFNVGDTGTIDGAINLAHESAHAINGHYNQIQILLSKQNTILQTTGNNSDEFKSLRKEFHLYLKKQKKFLHDCTEETETLIIELLFLDFLIDKNTISSEDKQLYINRRKNCFRNNLKIMFQEDLIYSKIIEIKKEKGSHSANLNEAEFNELCLRLKNNSHYDDIMSAFNDIANRRKLNQINHHSSYTFRYVVAEIISTVWYDKYISSSKKEKQQMLEDLKTFIKNNNNLDLNHITKLLLKTENYESIINYFVKISTKKENNLTN